MKLTDEVSRGAIYNLKPASLLKEINFVGKNIQFQSSVLSKNTKIFKRINFISYFDILQPHHHSNSLLIRMKVTGIESFDKTNSEIMTNDTMKGLLTILTWPPRTDRFPMLF